MNEQELEQEITRHVRAIIIAVRRFIADQAQAQNKQQEKEPAIKSN